MKLPRPFSGWVTSDRKAHSTYEAALQSEIQTQMLVLLDAACGEYSYHLNPGLAVEVILKHFNVAPKATS